MSNKEFIIKIGNHLKKIYGDDYKSNHLSDMKLLINKWDEEKLEPVNKVTQENIYLITYGDSIFEEGKDTLDTLNKFLKNEVKDNITDVHLLPMFEYTSDDGFSVVDYMKIDKKLGDWENIKELSNNYRLMFDFVANHISKSSEWFKGYLNGEEKYKDYFIKGDKNFDYSKVVRPRTSPIIHKYISKDKKELTAWATFSEDQVDINIKNFPVLVEMTNILLKYAKNGATSIRLDAIGFLWKESGTSCIHLDQTHEIIKLWRTLLDRFKPNTQIITETNVPHEENISYFGNTNDEAHMVYQFTLPPLTLYTLTTHNSTKLTEWAKTIDKVSETATYFNFLASHDGIGMRPTEGILSEEEKLILIDKTISNGGRVSYKNNTDGTKSVYELNINYSDALINNDEDITEEIQIKKIIAAHSVLLSLVGVPAIYYHSLLGSRNYYRGVEESGINRRINREKLEYEKISKELKNDSRRKGIFNGIQNLIKIRKQEKAFSPYAKQETLNLGKNIFALKRIDDKDEIIFLLNVTSQEVEVDNISGFNLITNKYTDGNIKLGAYEFAWIKNI